MKNRIEIDLGLEGRVPILMKYDDLFELEKIYHKLCKSIPRHENLNEEAHLLLTRPLKLNFLNYLGYTFFKNFVMIGKKI